jgi:hypothetical protein
MSSFKIDLSIAVVIVATESTIKMANKQASEIATDRAPGRS